MQIKNSTAFIIVLIVAFISYGAGKQSGLYDGTSGTGEKPLGGIVLSRDGTDRILDELSLAGFAGKSGESYEKAVANGIGRLCESNKKQRILINDIRREIDSATENAEIINASFTGISDAVDYGWQIILSDAKALQRIADLTREFDEDNAKDVKKPE